MIVAEDANGIVVRLHRDSDEAWALVPRYMERVAEFSRAYDGDADVETMQDLLQQAYGYKDPGVLMLAYVQSDGVIAGHLLATLETWFGSKIVSVVQYELDRATSRALTQSALAYVEKWAKERGAKFLQALAIDDKVARVYQTFDGFKRSRVLMRKAL